MIEITYFVHGATEDNIAHNSTGWNDLPLSERGVGEASSLKPKIQDQDFDLVVCSDLKRAMQSASIVFGDANIIYDKRLRECNYGDFNGKHKSFVVYEDHIDVPFTNGESLKDVEYRIKDLCKDLLEKYDGMKIAFMAHRAPQLVLETITKNITWEEAIERDWRKTKQWQPGWKYVISKEMF